MRAGEGAMGADQGALGGGVGKGHPLRMAAIRVAVAVLTAFLVSLGTLVAVVGATEAVLANRVAPGVTVAGIDLGLLDPTAARGRLLALHGPAATVTLATPAGPRSLSLSALGVHPDVDALMAAAIAVAHTGNPLLDFVQAAEGALVGRAIPVVYAIDETRAREGLAAVLADLERPPVSATLALAPGGLTVLPGRMGTTVDMEAILRAMAEAVAGPATADPPPAALTIPVRLSLVAPPLGDLDAQRIRLTVERQVGTPLRLAAGSERWTIPTDVLQSFVRLRPGPDGLPRPTIDPAAIRRFLTGFAEKVAVAPADATFLTDRAGAVVGVRPATEGRRLDVAATTDRILAALGRRLAGEDPVVEPAFVTLSPALTTQAATAVAPLMERISTWTTRFEISERNGYGANIWVPAHYIDGTVLAPGATFDFWKAVGPVTPERGFTLGGAIIQGHSDPQGAIGGGICSTSTTLFNAALRAGLQMGARRNHFYYISRYPLGLDATVFISESGATQTMSFTNDTPYPILIKAAGWRSGIYGFVRFDLYSVPTGRTVTLSTPMVKNVVPATTIIQPTTSLPPGTRQQLEWPTAGMDVWVTRTVRDATGRVIHQETYYSHYTRVNGLILVGVAPETGSAGGGATPTPSPAP